MKFKNYIETESGIKDTSTSPGTAGQLLSSTVTGTSWIDQNTISSGSSEVVDIQVKNISSGNGGVSLSKGDPVYIYGSVGASARLYVDLADADSTAINNLGDNKMPCVGLLDQDLAPNGEGTATVVGKLRNLITSPIDGATPNENDTIYVKSGGGLTLTKPAGSTNLIQNVGQVGRVSTSADGNIVVAALLRSNDVPNLPTGRLFVGTAANTSLASDVIYVDDSLDRVGIGTDNPQEKLHIYSTGAGAVRAEIESTQATDALLKYTNSIGSYATFLTQSGQFSIYDYNALSHRFYMLTNGNVGINTTSANYKLEVNGTLGVSRTDGIIFAGSGGVGQGNKITSDTSNNLIFSTSLPSAPYTTTEKVRILNNGNVGIGTTTPAHKLQINGTAGIRNSMNSQPIYGYANVGAGDFVVGGNSVYPGVITLYNQDTTISAGQDLGVIQFVGKSDTSTGYTSSMIKGSTQLAAGSGSSGGGILSFLTTSGYGNVSERMRINHIGNVGIGITIPNEKLVIKNSTSNTGVKILSYNNAVGTEATLKFATAAADAGYEKAAIITRNYSSSFGRSDMHFALDSAADSGNVQFSDTKMTILNNGNVGIGTTSPVNLLNIQRSTSAGTVATIPGVVFSNRNTANSIFVHSGIFADTYRDISNPHYSGGIWFTRNPQSSNLSSSSDIVFGTQTSVSAGSLPSERMRITSSGNVGIGTTSPTSGKLQIAIPNYATGIRLDGPSGTTFGYMYFTSNNIYRGNISPTSTGVNYSSASDYRLKENVIKLQNSTERLKKLKPSNFNFLENSGETVDGFIAHEVQEVVPEAVVGKKDEVGPDGKPNYQGVDNSKIVPLLTAALQEAISKIEQLETRIQILENK